MPTESETSFLFEPDDMAMGPCFQDDTPADSVPPRIHNVAPEDREAYLRLALTNGVGPRTLAMLLDRFGSASDVVSASLSQLGSVSGIGPKTSLGIKESVRSDLLEKVAEHCSQNDVKMMVPGDPSFPRLLMELADPPVLLFVKGEFAPSDALSIAMVGTRHCTSYGATMSERLARSLSQSGLTIVSGLARGVDAICHRAAMDAGGRTIAVLGSSVTDIYPPEHSGLSLEIVQKGVLVSETHPFAKPKAGVFPQRNRIISGLSLGVVVVEAAERSGSLITARHAGEQGRDVFAVPGSVTSRMSRGCHALIRDGAILIQDGADVIEHLGPLVEGIKLEDGSTVSHPAELQLNEVELAVLQCVDSHPQDIDQVIVKSGLPASRVLSTLSVLQMKGLVKRPTGRTVSR